VLLPQSCIFRCSVSKFSFGLRAKFVLIILNNSVAVRMFREWHDANGASTFGRCGTPTPRRSGKEK
jgi:hypothetical protein